MNISNKDKLNLIAGIFVIALIATMLVSLYFVNQSYNDGFRAGLETERPLEAKIRKENCVPKSELPYAYPYFRFEDVTTIVLQDSETGEKFPAKVCDEDQATTTSNIEIGF